MYQLVYLKGLLPLVKAIQVVSSHKGIVMCAVLADYLDENASATKSVPRRLSQPCGHYLRLPESMHLWPATSQLLIVVYFVAAAQNLVSLQSTSFS